FHHQHLHSFPTRRSSDLSPQTRACNRWQAPKTKPPGGGFAMRATAYWSDEEISSGSGLARPSFLGSGWMSSCTSAVSTPLSSVLDRKSTRLNSSHVKISY